MPTAIETTPTTVRIYIADQYLRGCPSNTCGRAVGIGLTPAQAVAACKPHSNQAPWAPRRAREVVLVDGQSDDDDIAIGILGEPTGLESPAHRAAYRAAERRQWSVFVAKAVEAGLLSAPPQVETSRSGESGKHPGHIRMSIWMPAALHREYLTILAERASNQSLDVRAHVQRVVAEHRAANGKPLTA